MSTAIFLTIDHADLIARQSGARRLYRALTSSLRAMLTVVALFVLAYGIVSGPAQFERLSYLWRNWLDLTPKEQFSPSQFLGGAISHTYPTVGEGRLVIPSIELDAPILWNVPVADSLNGLQQGVVQVSESYLPGEVGRTFIVGHSSGYWWMNNPWTKVFSLLDQTTENDLVYLKYNGTLYVYRITEREVVSPYDVRVLQDDTLERNQLALMTCTPVGTNLNRLVVYAEPVDVRVQ